MKQKIRVFAGLTATPFLVCMVVVGCGGRYAPAGSEAAGGSGGSGGTSGSAGNDGSGGSTGGVGGSGGSTGGSGGSTGGVGGGAGKGGAGTGGTVPPGTIRCGTSICAPIVTGTSIANLEPCCPMDTPNACGGTLPGAGCFTTTPGVPDPRCPSVTAMGFPIPGCCRPNGMCGVDLRVITLGCNDPVLVGGMPAFPCRANQR